MSDEVVVIEEATAVLSGSYIPWLRERYPFSKLTPSQWTDDTKTAVKGPSFVIPHDSNPPSVLAAGRKRFKHCRFISRKVASNGDIRVWLHPDSPAPLDAPRSSGRTTAPKVESAPAEQPPVVKKAAAPAKMPAAVKKRVVQKPKMPAA